MKSKDIQIVCKVHEHCSDIDETMKRFGNRQHVFLADDDYFRSVSMSLMQIGELGNSLSDPFKKSHHPDIWNKAYKLRNIFAHHYGIVDKNIVWKIASLDVPDLRELCHNIIYSFEQEENSLAEQVPPAAIAEGKSIDIIGTDDEDMEH